MDHSPTIPLELVDLILDFLHSDDDTLSACTLVCKSWLPSARFHLLSRIALHTSNADSFLDEVEIVSAQVHEDMMLPKFIATGLMNVTSLRIDGLDLSTVPPALPFSFPKLECLCLEGFEAKSFGVIALWISGFPLLRSLKLAGDWDGDEIETPIVARIPELLHTLDVNCPLKVLFEWLLSLPVVPVTSSLVLRDIWTEESSTISRYLAVAGSSLRSLTVVYPRKEVICLDLKQNTCLQTLSLESYTHAMARLVTGILSRLGAMNLENLRMTILGPPGVPTANEIDNWLPVDQILSLPQFQHLRDVRFVRWHLNDAAVDGAATTLLPVCGTRGILTTEYF